MQCLCSKLPFCFSGGRMSSRGTEGFSSTCAQHYILAFLVAGCHLVALGDEWCPRCGSLSNNKKQKRKQQWCFATILKHVPDFMTKLHALESSVGVEARLGTLGSIPEVIANSPYACCRIVYERAVTLRIPEHLAAIQPSLIDGINKTTYNLFFDSIYRRRAAVVRLEEVYRKR